MKWFNNIPAWFVFLLIPFLFIGPTLSSYHVAVGTEFSDIQITHAPNIIFIQKAILEDQQIPLWNPLILSGYPFDADPLSGLWYPPGWLAMLFPQPFGLNLLVILHIFLGGYGLYQYLKQVGLPSNLSLFGGICFTLLPKLYAHFGAGHVTYLFAVCLTPWLLYATVRSGKRLWIWQALIVAAMILADVRWIPYGILLWIAAEYHVFTSIGADQAKSVLGVAIRMGKSLLGGLLLASPLLFPFLQFVALSTRSQLTAADNLTLSLPVERILTLIFPTLGGSPEWMIFTGSGLTLLGIIGIISANHKKALPWLFVFLISLLFSLGDQIPGMRQIISIPVLDSLRVPPRILFPGSIALIILAMLGLSALLEEKAEKIRNVTLGISFVFFLAAGLIAGTQWNRSGTYQLWLITPLILFCFFVLIGLYHRRSLSPRLFVVGVCLFVFLEIGMIGKSTFTTTENTGGLPPSILQQIKPYPFERIYSPSYSISQVEAVENSIGLTEGVHPLQLEEYVQFLSRASGVPANQYSVVQPPLKTGNPKVDNQDAVPDLSLLDRLNVRYLIASYPIQQNDWPALMEGPNTWVYKNEHFSGYPFMQGVNGQIRPVTLLDYSAKSS